LTAALAAKRLGGWIGGVAHVINAVDKGNYAEARQWLEQGRKFLQD
jgi:hypothetical protein